jgi:arylsulfatase A-like enzyme
MDTWDPTHLGVRTIPEIFRSAGYYTFNEGKNHYNFVDRDDQQSQFLFWTSIDDVRFFDRVFSQSEIHNITGERF